MTCYQHHAHIHYLVSLTLPHAYKSVGLPSNNSAKSKLFAIHLLELVQILKKEPEERMSLHEVMEHPWVTCHGYSPLPTVAASGLQVSPAALKPALLSCVVRLPCHATHSPSCSWLQPLACRYVKLHCKLLHCALRACTRMHCMQCCSLWPAGMWRCLAGRIENAP